MVTFTKETSKTATDKVKESTLGLTAVTIKENG
jgi:hypothetical protein